MQTCATDNKKRNREIFEYHQAHPEITLRKLGKKLDLSQQRVSQLIRTYLCHLLIKRRNQLLVRYHNRYIATGEGVQGELFALTRPKQYYRVQQAVRKRTCLVCPVKTAPIV